MSGVFEIAPSGRAKCRGCGKPIAKDALRFGERRPNPYGDGEMSLWFHVPCGALMRPEAFLEGLETEAAPSGDREQLEAWAREGVTHPRLPRIHGAGRAPTGRARCRSCRKMIAKEAWRIPLVYFEESRFQPSGFIHAVCAGEYFGTASVLSRIEHFTMLAPDEVAEVERELGAEG